MNTSRILVSRSGLLLRTRLSQTARVSTTLDSNGAAAVVIRKAAFSSTKSNPRSIEDNNNENSAATTSRKQQQQQHAFLRKPVVACPSTEPYSPKPVPPHIPRPPYAATGMVPFSKLTEEILLHDESSADRMLDAARLAANTLDLACQLAVHPGITTDEIDTAVHNAIIEAGAYPSPLNYAGFPKSVCSSVNEIICHGIPDQRPLQRGDVVSFDVSCFLNGVHGDNCATVIVGDYNDDDDDDEQQQQQGCDVKRNVKVNHPDNLYKQEPGIRTQFNSVEEEAHFLTARRLVQATREAVAAGIAVCKPEGCLSDIGAAIEEVADEYGYSSVQKYRGHGISHIFHSAPFVKHFRNHDECMLLPGMIFTIEPMLTEGSSDCYEWNDNWTVSTWDDSLAAQFEHTVYITEDGVQVLTIPEDT